MDDDKATQQTTAPGEETIAVELRLNQWILIDFLARRGAVAELDRHLKTLSVHRTDCISAFVDACVALHGKLPIPETSEPHD